ARPIPRPAPVIAITLLSSAPTSFSVSNVVLCRRHATGLTCAVMKPAGIHHVSICVADAEAGLAFYRDVLGLTQLPRPDLGPGHWLAAGGAPRAHMESRGL